MIFMSNDLVASKILLIVLDGASDRPVNGRRP